MVARRRGEGAGTRPGLRGGFTLAEAMVALTISSIVVVLVATVFLAQNRYYATQVQRSGAQDVARSVTELVAEAVRLTAAGGITAAQSDSLTVRVPMAIGGVCRQWGGHVGVYVQGGRDALQTAEIAGYAGYDTLTATWSYQPSDWGSLWDRLATGDCAGNGADTIGAYDDYLRLTVSDPVPAQGTPFMIFREVSFSVRASQLDDAVMGLYHGVSGDTLMEYATGLDTTARFQYRLSGNTGYVDAVGSSDLDRIDAVRVVADARTRARAGGTDDVTFGWSVNIPVGNVR